MFILKNKKKVYKNGITYKYSFFDAHSNVYHMCITGHSSGTAESSRISTFDIHAHDILMWVCRVQLQLNGIIGFFKKQELIEKIGPKFTPAKTLRIGNFGSALIQGEEWV